MPIAHKPYTPSFSVISTSIEFFTIQIEIIVN